LKQPRFVNLNQFISLSKEKI